MKKIILGLATTIVSVCGFTVRAQEKVQDLGEYVVTGTRFETPIEKSGKTIYKITAEQIQKMPGKTVADLLNTLPGINVDGAFGTPGSNLSYSIRGGRNKHTLILIDGLPITDPSSISNDYDLRLLESSMIESIEVLKGGASTLYGTGAASGVINIKLKEAVSEKPAATLSQTIGSFRSSNTNLGVGGKTGNLSYNLGGTYTLSEGISAAEDNDPTVEFGKDGFDRYIGRGNLKYHFSENFSLGGKLSYERLQSDYDDGAFIDADNEFTIKQFNIGLNPKFTHQKGQLELKVNYNKINREFESAFPSTNEGENIQADLAHQYIINSQIKTILGVQYQNYKFDIAGDTPKATNIDPYLNVSADIIGGLTLNTGVRVNINSEYGSNFVYNLNPSYLFNLDEKNNLKLFGSYSTAFVVPSLYQLFSVPYGNIDLDPEETASVEFGASLYLGNRLTFNIEYFDRTEENAVDFVSQYDDDGDWIGGGYANVVGKREISGWEFDISFQASDKLTFTGHHTKYSFGDPTQFYRLPDTKYGLRGNYTLNGNTNFQLSLTHFGERQSAIFSDPFLVTMDAYNLVDLLISHELNDGNILLTGAINNLLDEDFVGVYGFSSKPVNFNIGLTVKF